MNLWFLFIFVHAVLAVTAFITEIIMISPWAGRHRTRLSRVFIAATLAMTVMVIAATISHWSELQSSQRIAFSLLPFLGAYMVFRTWRARQLLRERRLDEFVDAVGFVLISYFDGFMIVTMLDIGAPPWAVVLGAVAAVYIGTRYVAVQKRRLKMA